MGQCLRGSERIIERVRFLGEGYEVRDMSWQLRGNNVVESRTV